MGGSYIEPGGGEGAVAQAVRVNAFPVDAAVTAAHGAAEVGFKDEVRIAGVHVHRQRVFAPVGAERLVEPNIMNGGRRFRGILPDVLPAGAGAQRLGDSEILVFRVLS